MKIITKTINTFFIFAISFMCMILIEWYFIMIAIPSLFLFILEVGTELKKASEFKQED